MKNEVEPQALMTALQHLMEEYPTDPEDTGPATVLTLAGAQGAVELQPGQVQWLLGLVMDESATNRNAHVDGNQQCGHCEGTGSAVARRPADIEPQDWRDVRRSEEGIEEDGPEWDL
ncbi:hypothetical protein [Kitasatospora sp. HPMI-4]|uniref:hypothetical protein n=1 Tax=Kitasatospora sp. HPMI-4 TaxID=3448443 RepID=UPI003F19BB4C